MSDKSIIDPQDGFGLLRSYSRHRDFVRLALGRVAHEIEERALIHDASKMMDDEFSGFSRINAAARVHKFGSPEYSAGLAQERPTIDLHFKRNSHHPERPKLHGQDGVKEWTEGGNAENAHIRRDYLEEMYAMTFLDVIEMVCDWWGARKGYDDPRSWADTVKLNFESKGKYLSPEQRWLAEQVATWIGRFEP